MEFLVFALKRNYCRMVAHRLGRDSFYRKKMPEKAMRKVAEGLLCLAKGSAAIKLAKLFVEAQFDAMPPTFCRGYFKRNYPPPNVVFGGECWRRYKEYSERGVRDAE